MSSLKNILLNIPLEREALTTNTTSLTYGDLQNIINKNASKTKKLKKSSVVINARDRFEFAKLLFLLDGEVHNILFLPHDINKLLHSRYFNEAGVNYEVYLENNILQYKTIKKADKESDAKETNWIIPTSGTTSSPKLVAHTFQSLTRSTKVNIETGSRYRWGLVFDIYRFSGIQVFLQAMLSGSTLIISEADMPMSEILNNIIKNRCNALSATSSFWRKVLMSKEIERLNFELITLGGEIADENILQALKDKFPNAKIVHIYASTEAGVGFSVSDGHAGFPKSYIDSSINGISLKLSARNTLMIKNEKQIQKYLTNNDLYQNDGYIDTGDIIEIKGDRVYFLGRDSGSINVGGNKVLPEEVEHTLLGSNFVHAAFVYPKKNPIIGNIVCADVVLKDNTVDIKSAKSEILRYCRKKLENYKVPAMIKFVDELETTQSTKLKRN